MKLLDNVFPLWGPYGKKYMGISRIADEDMTEGVRFDFTASPAVFAGDARVPNATFMCGCRSWECEKDYSFFSYRFDLNGRDEAYAVSSYIKLGDEQTLVRTELFNNSDVKQNFIVNFFSSMEYRSEKYTCLSLPEKCIFVKATDYEDYTYAVTRPWDGQNPDANKKGVFQDNGFTFGKGLGDRCPKWHMPHRFLPPFGGEKGDRVVFYVKENVKFASPVLTVRYRTVGIHYEQGKQVGVRYVNSDRDAEFLLNGEKIVFDGSHVLRIKTFPLSSLPEKLELESLCGDGIEFDFFALTEKEDAEKISVYEKKHEFIPDISEKKREGGYEAILTYGEGRGEYHINTFSENTRFRRINTGCLEDCLNVRLSNNDESFDDLTETFSNSFKRKKSDFGFFHNTMVHTVFAEPGESAVVYAVISKGEHKRLTLREYENIYIEKAKGYNRLSLNSAGEKYEFSNGLLRASVLTNVVYPIFKHDRFIIHHTPGKRWDCLYTWDSGFIGLGMLDYAPELSRYILDTYLSDEDNPDYVFVHHGSPVPVQFYVFLEMLNRGYCECDEYYDRLKLYLDFFLGKIRGSTTGKFKSGLLTTYDYFYSCSGMDDYPPQVAMMQDNIRDTTAPVISTAQGIRILKIMRYAADVLGRQEDKKVFEADINRLTDALEVYSWDEKEGWYSYILHNDKYEPVGIYRENGINLNRGIDGIYPLISDSCPTERKKRLLDHLKNEKEMLSPYGISAVDMTAPYFRVNGYWNGNVWFSHQWFFFKAMLDAGERDFAYEIAKRALEVWKREAERTYYTFEMVSVVTGQGGWFHNFGGLSSPVNIWACTYFKPGTVTTGFDTFVEYRRFNSDFSEGEIHLRKVNKEESTVILCLNEKIRYNISADDSNVKIFSRFPGEAELVLPKESVNIAICVSKF